jgi:hypothetical protein
MSSNKILFTSDGKAITPIKIRDKIAHFGDSYIDATQKIIQYSGKLDRDGEVFIKCASLILSNFGMTRSGPFKKGVNKKILPDCWSKIGGHLIAINKLILKSGCSRDRLLLELDQQQLEELIAEIWLVMKQLLPFTMGKTTYGLVGASKILFAVLPEIVLPIDNKQWLHVFKTVDIGDVINQMISEIKYWETATGARLNDMDPLGRLTTLPAVYNVMAMAARPN